MKLILTTESQPMDQALRSIKSVTGEAAESICNKYSQKGTAVDLAEAYVLSLENIPTHSWRERKKKREEGERDRWGN